MKRRKPDLRDLAEKIRKLAKKDPRWSQAAPVIECCCDHLCAISRMHELEREQSDELSKMRR